MHKEQGERRDFLPDLIAHLERLGAGEIVLEEGYGLGVGVPIDAYLDVSGRVRVGSYEECLDQDVVVVLRCPEQERAPAAPPGSRPALDAALPDAAGPHRPPRRPGRSRRQPRRDHRPVRAAPRGEPRGGRVERRSRRVPRDPATPSPLRSPESAPTARHAVWVPAAWAAGPRSPPPATATRSSASRSSRPMSQGSRSPWSTSTSRGTRTTCSDASSRPTS